MASKSKNISVRIPEDILKNIDKKAKQETKSRTEIIVDFLKVEDQEKSVLQPEIEVPVHSIKVREITEKTKIKTERRFWALKKEQVILELQAEYNQEINIWAYLDWLLYYRCSWGRTLREWLRYQIKYLKGRIPDTCVLMKTFPCLMLGDIEIIYGNLCEFNVRDVSSFDKFLAYIKEHSLDEIKKFEWWK